MAEFFDPQILSTFRKTFNSTNLFSEDIKQKQHFNLICAVMDRVSTCINKLNTYETTPKTEEDLIVFLVFGAMLKDAIEDLLKTLFGRNYHKLPTNIFNGICVQHKLIFDSKYSQDDAFFSRLRALVFAHPTSTNICARETETVHCPFLIVDPCSVTKGCIGVMLYTKGKTGCQILEIPFQLLKDYLQSQYKLIELCTPQLLTTIQEKRQIWAKHKVNRTGTPIEILKDIIAILKERFVAYDIFEEALGYLQTDTSIEDNKQNVAKFKKAIEQVLPDICESIDQLNHDNAINIIDLICYARLNTNNMTDERSKISTFLLEGPLREHEDYVRLLTKLFANKFAKKWVTIDTDNMSFEEIKLLVAVACYCAKEEQEKEGVVK